MTPSRSNIHSKIIFIFLCTITFSIAMDSNDDNSSQNAYNLRRSRPARHSSTRNHNVYSPFRDSEICMRVMKKYCNVTDPGTLFPNILECILEAIDNWSESTFPEGVLKKYYLGLIEKEGSLASLSSHVLKREDYCNQPEIPNGQLCKEVLANFKDTAEDAVKYALYSKRAADFYTINYMLGGDLIIPNDNYSLGYMHHIKKFVHVNEELIQKPIHFCRDVSYNYSNVDFPLDWNPYLSENMYVNIS